MSMASSIRRQLLYWLVPTVAALLAIGAVTAYGVVLESATRAYDRALFDGALALARQVRREGNRLRFDLQPQALTILTTDKFDRIFYAVRDRDGHLLGGDPALQPARPGPPPEGERWVYEDGLLHGQAVRMAILETSSAGMPFLVVVAETTVKRDQLVREALIGILLPEVALAALTLLFVIVGVRRGLLPLERLRQQLTRRSPSDLRRLDTTRLPDELRPLGAEVNSLLTRLGTSLDAQRSLVADAAHQLRTPIAALLAQVESMQRQPDAPPALSESIPPIREGVQRLAHLVHQLLTLARAEEVAHLHRERVDLAGIVRRCADRWVPLAIERDIDLGFELQPAPVRGVPLLLEELLGNLVDNAIRHTPAHSTITVRCHHRAETTFLQVDDDGPGIPEAMRERVFERFVRLDGQAGTGCGLGLAIVRQIAARHEASVRLAEAPGGGTRAEVRFPAATEDGPADRTGPAGDASGGGGQRPAATGQAGQCQHVSRERVDDEESEQHPGRMG